MTDPIREQVIDLRKKQILEAAAKVFAEKGFHRASTKAIAKAAGISEGTIYNYFTSKQELLTALLQRLGDMSPLEETQHDSEHDPQRYYAEDFKARLAIMNQNLEILRPVLSEALIDRDLRAVMIEGLRQQYVEPVEAYLQAHIESGDIRQITNTALMTRMMQTVAIGLMVLRLLGDPVLEEEWDQLPEALASMLYEGLKPR
jgi:AcrR family transcriptional regulator